MTNGCEVGVGVGAGVPASVGVPVGASASEAVAMALGCKLVLDRHKDEGTGSYQNSDDHEAQNNRQDGASRRSRRRRCTPGGATVVATVGASGVARIERSVAARADGRGRLRLRYLGLVGWRLLLRCSVRWLLRRKLLLRRHRRRARSEVETTRLAERIVAHSRCRAPWALVRHRISLADAPSRRRRSHGLGSDIEMARSVARTHSVRGRHGGCSPPNTGLATTWSIGCPRIGALDLELCAFPLISLATSCPKQCGYFCVDRTVAHVITI